jgi:short-subunit dehydrogenase
LDFYRKVKKMEESQTIRKERGMALTEERARSVQKRESAFPMRAVITGGTSGIGLATAELFARKGVEVGVLSENFDHIERAVRTIRNEGGRAFPLHVDLSVPDQAREVMSKIESEHGPVDLLINNAGIGLQADIPEVTERDLRLLFEVNFIAMALLSRDAFRLMAERGYGQIVNVSSAAARRTLPGLSVYGSTKAAMHAFTQALRVEGRRAGIRVTEILPMSVRTPFFENAHNRSERSYAVGSFSTTPERLAQKIYDATRKPVPEVYTSGLARIVLGLDACFPKIMDAILTRRLRDPSK